MGQHNISGTWWSEIWWLCAMKYCSKNRCDWGQSVKSPQYSLGTRVRSQQQNAVNPRRLVSSTLNPVRRSPTAINPSRRLSRDSSNQITLVKVSWSTGDGPTIFQPNGSTFTGTKELRLKKFTANERSKALLSKSLMRIVYYSTVGNNSFILA